MVFLLASTLAAGGACLSDGEYDGAGSDGRGGAGGGSEGSGGQTGTGGSRGTQNGTGGSQGNGTHGSGGSAAGGSVASGGSSAAGGASGAGGASSELASFATAREIVTVTCGGSDCHQPGGTPPALLVDDSKLYSTFMSYVSTKCGGRVLIQPGEPDESAFYLIQAGLCGDQVPRMPLGCVDRCTPPDYLEGLRQWILAGAPRD